mmetsp:Transcript_9704/g.30814  ORF Transcript_9704/g.30814 Transcript_9704/m.30814 type:complete len:253 (+) Transcript_9704:477-1235(+)
MATPSSGSPGRGRTCAASRTARRWGATRASRRERDPTRPSCRPYLARSSRSGLARSQWSTTAAARVGQPFGTCSPSRRSCTADSCSSTSPTCKTTATTSARSSRSPPRSSAPPRSTTSAAAASTRPSPPSPSQSRPSTRRTPSTRCRPLHTKALPSLRCGGSAGTGSSSSPSTWRRGWGMRSAGWTRSTRWARGRLAARRSPSQRAAATSRCAYSSPRRQTATSPSRAAACRATRSRTTPFSASSRRRWARR